MSVNLKCKSIEPGDYEDLSRGLRDVYYAKARCDGLGANLYFPHEHRMWEYASAVEAP